MAKALTIQKGGLSPKIVGFQADLTTNQFSFVVVLYNPDGSVFGQQQVNVLPTAQEDSPNFEAIPTFEEVMGWPEAQEALKGLTDLGFRLSGLSKTFDVVDVPDEPVKE